MNLFYGVVIFTILQIFVGGIEYGPSLSSLTGVFVNWKGPDLLAIESGRKLLLKNYPGLAATIPLVSGDSTASSEQIFKERGISTVGEFIVEAPKGFGIIVVIQELKLRKVTKDRGNSSSNVSCSDFLQIGEARSDGSGMVPEKICGTVLRDDKNVRPKGLLGPRTYQSLSNRLRVAFSHAYVTELVHSLLGSKQKHILKAELTFTAYKSNCTVKETLNNITTEAPLEETLFKVCKDYKFSGNLTCISSLLFCDEIFNCGGDTTTLGSDDDSFACPDRPEKTTENFPIEDSDPPEKETPDGLSYLETYLGIPSLSSYTTKKYERKFRPSYVSGSSSGSGFLYDYSTRKPTVKTAVTSTTPKSNPVGGGSIEINVVGPSRETSSSNILLSTISKEDPQAELENEIYSRRELAHAINSVIYGVAVFIIFTIFVTVFVVCVTKRIQMAWTARSQRRQSSLDPESNRRRISTPGILPQSVTSTPNNQSRRPSECDPGVTASQQTDIIVATDQAEQCDPPPAYHTLFPIN